MIVNDTRFKNSNHYEKRNATFFDQYFTVTSINAQAQSTDNHEVISSVVVCPNLSRGDIKFQSNIANIELIELFSQNRQVLFPRGTIDRKGASIDLSSFRNQTIMARTSKTIE